MATKKLVATEQSTVKVRIIDFEMSGSDQSLQESLQTIAAAFSRGNQTVQISRRLPNQGSNSVNGLTAETEVELTEEEFTEGDTDENDSARTTERKATSARKPSKPVVVKILNDISFTDAKPTLKQFYEEKKPGKNNLANYLVIAYWYKHHAKIEELTVDHFHTAFRHVGFATPKNALQPMRDLKNNRDGRMMGGKAPHSAIINHLGENYVDALNKVNDAA